MKHITYHRALEMRNLINTVHYHFERSIHNYHNPYFHITKCRSPTSLMYECSMLSILVLFTKTGRGLQIDGDSPPPLLYFQMEITKARASSYSHLLGRSWKKSFAIKYITNAFVFFKFLPLKSQRFKTSACLIRDFMSEQEHIRMGG